MKENEVERAVRQVYQDYFAEGGKTVLLMFFSKKRAERDLEYSFNRMQKRILQIRSNTSMHSGAFTSILTMVSEEESAREVRRWSRYNKRFLLHFMLSEIELESIQGDLAENYAQNAACLGQRRAKWLMYKQVAVSIWPFIKRWLNNFGAIAWITNCVRRLIG